MTAATSPSQLSVCQGVTQLSFPSWFFALFSDFSWPPNPTILCHFFFSSFWAQLSMLNTTCFLLSPLDCDFSWLWTFTYSLFFCWLLLVRRSAGYAEAVWWGRQRTGFPEVHHLVISEGAWRSQGRLPRESKVWPKSWRNNESSQMYRRRKRYSRYETIYKNAWRRDCT